MKNISCIQNLQNINSFIYEEICVYNIIILYKNFLMFFFNKLLLLI